MINCVYIHIPFCNKKCKYCSFCSFPMLHKKKEYIEALIKEIKYYYKNEPLKSLYLGGGTPSLLDISDLNEILRNFNINQNTELTIEFNPNDKEKIKKLNDAPFNRLSLGVQSFDDDILASIGRTHTKKEIDDAINKIKKSKINNFSIDLMYGLPNQTLENWDDTLKKAVEYEPNHISLYGLKIEEGSYFYKFKPQNLPSLDLQAKMYEHAINFLKKYYIHYEFSNFAKEERYFSKHNLSYWQRKNYYGFGLSASGFIGKKRYTNTFNFKEYLINPTKKEYEILKKQNEIEEEIFLGLRIYNGINFQKINEKYDVDICKIYEKQFEKFLKYNFLEKTEYGVKLTIKGILLSNEILCEFLFD